MVYGLSTMVGHYFYLAEERGTLPSAKWQASEFR